MAPRLKLFLLVITLLFKGIIGQQYILKSDSPNLDGNEVCPRNIRLVCVGIRVLVLYWNATTTDGSELVLASHSGPQEDYQVETHFRGISYNITPDFVFPYQDDRSFFDVNATIVIDLSSVVKQNIIGFSCGSTSHTLSSNLYSTNVTVIGQPPSPSITGCCHPSTSISSDPITCSVLSNTVISFCWPPQYTSRYQIQRYRVEYDGRLVAPECLSSHFASPIQTCNFFGLNDRTEYTFSISSLNCGDQESPMTNLTISLAFLSEPAKIQGVTITPSYNNNLQLIEIIVQWNHLESKCPGIDYDYMIFLKNSSGFIIQNSTVSCDGVEICNSLLKVLRDYDYDIYIVEISAYYYLYSRIYYNVSYTSNPINGVSSIKPNISVEFLPCSVKCYSNSSGTCEIHYIQNSTILLNDTISGTVNADNISVPELQSGIVNYSATFYIEESTFTLQDSSIIQYAYKWTGGILAWVIVGPILMTLSIVFFILINIVLLRRWKDFKHHLLLKAAIIFILTLSLLILLISLSIWIAGLVEIAKSGNCESMDQPQPILIAAFVVYAISFITNLIVVIVYKIYTCHFHQNKVQRKTKEQELLEIHGATDEFSFKFGMEVASDIENKNCVNCVTLSHLHGRCGACNKRLCSKCSNMNYAFVPAKRVNISVCNICWKAYWEENIEMFKINNISDLMLIVNKPGSRSEDLYKYMFTYCVGFAENKCRTCDKIIYGQYFMAAEFSYGEEMCDICYMLKVRMYHLHKKLEKQNIDPRLVELTLDMFINSKNVTEEVTATTY